MKSCGQVYGSIAAKVSDAVAPDIHHNTRAMFSNTHLSFSLENEVIRNLYTPYNLKFPFELGIRQGTMPWSISDEHV